MTKNINEIINFIDYLKNQEYISLSTYTSILNDIYQKDKKEEQPVNLPLGKGQNEKN